MPSHKDLQALSLSIQRQRPGSAVRLVETHISWVLITDSLAYKIKRPVKFAFLDFLGLASRKHFCEEELRLNKRLAPDIYLKVVPICRSPETGELSIGPDAAQTRGEIVDWAVKMRAFKANATLDQSAHVMPGQVDAIADAIAAFHQSEKPIPASSVFGSTDLISQLADENLQELEALLPQDPRIRLLKKRSRKALKNLRPFFERRQREGFIRECHGDLHLGNIAWVDHKPIIFDCIEFSESLRKIDVINEVAFLFMDFHAHGQPGLAWRFLNRWLEHTGDYEGLEGLMFYASYRALVRAKIGMHQGRPADCENYLAAAVSLVKDQTPQLTLMHGFSGSGKTFRSQYLLETQYAVRIRSDIERKRLAGISRNAPSGSALESGLYQSRVTEKTFDRLLQATETLLSLGFRVIVDATFLKRALRSRFIELGRRLMAPVQIVDMAVSPQQCQERIIQRQAAQADASEATLEVLAHQVKTAEPLTTEERTMTQTCGS